MEYNFDEIIPRRGTESVKWDTASEDGIIPMWVADMDFKAAPPVMEALRKRLEHGVFGYTRVPHEYYEATADWFSRRHALDIKPEWIIHTPGVVPALTAIIKALTEPGDKVIFQSPAYNCFFTSPGKNGCSILLNHLVYRDNSYTIDYEDLERKAADPAAKLMIFCNPHNPSGRVWTPEEIRKAGEICFRHGVTVLADEIHCELVYRKGGYTPFASISEEFLMKSVTCTSPSKAFNLAGLQVANIFAADTGIREKIAGAVRDNEISDLNSFAPDALIAAYNEGEEWLDQLCSYIYGNYLYLKGFFSNVLPDYPVLPLEGTYLVWMDIRHSGMDSGRLAGLIMEKGKVKVNPGSMYGPEGKDFIRINIACPAEILSKGLSSIAEVLNSL